MKKRVIASTMAVFMTAASLCMTAPTAIYAEEITEEAVLTDHLEEDPGEIKEAEESKVSDEAAESDTIEESKVSDEAAESAPTEEPDDIEVTEESDAVGGKTEKADGSDGIEALSESPYENTPEVTEEETVPLAREAAGEKYTVTFDSNGGSDVPDQTVNAGEKAEKPADPVNGDYHFLGWFVEPTLDNIVNPETWKYNTFDFSAPITENVNLTALWAAVLSVNTTGAGEGYIDVVEKGEEPEFDEEYRHSSAQETAIKDWYEDFTVAAKAAENSVFVRWIDKDTGETYSTDARIDLNLKKDLNLVAEFDSILVVFDSNGGSEVENQYVVPGAAVKKPEDPVNGNLRFIGWFKDPSLESLYDPETYEYNTFDFNTPVTETTTLTALWGAVFTVEVSGDPSCGQIDITDPDENLEFSDTEPMQSSYTNAVLGLMDTFKVGAKASEGYRFVKWEDKDTKKTYATDEVIEVEIRENLNLAAVFEKDVQKATPTAAPTAAPTATSAPTATPAPTKAATATTAPKTGDDTPVMTWFGILLMAAFGLGITGERKFRNRKEK